MRNLLFLFLAVPILGFGQNFSGEITYQITIVPKSDTVDLKKIIDLKHGTTAKYIITRGRYKSTYFKDNEYNYSYTYNEDNKRMYDDYANRSYITYRDSQKANYEYFGSEIFKDSTSTILDYKCYMVSTEAEYGRSRAYYSDDIKVNYEDFKGHKVGNWYNKLKEVEGAIVLKTITEHDTYIQVQEAIKIDKREVLGQEFELPDKPICADFSALDTRVELLEPTPGQIGCYRQKVAEVSTKDGEKFTCYVSFLLEKDGSVKFVDTIEKDEEGFYSTAVDIVKACGFKFKPGMINGQKVDSQVYFPIEFLK